MKYIKKYPLIFIIFCLAVITFFIWFVIYGQNTHSSYLKVAFFDVGQGDAIFIEAPNGRQMLIDGGPDQKVLAQLSEVMPFGDKSIDMVMATHPDADHIGGLPAVLDNYAVSLMIENGAVGTTKNYEALEQEITAKNIKKEIARKGMKIILDKEKNIYLDILYPDRDISKMDSNDGSIVAKLVYGDKSFMLTGDATSYVENIIYWNESPETLHSNVLKLGHHGARTSNSLMWLKKVNPDTAIVSAGVDNRYGHPHQETLERLNTLKIPYRSTAKEGNIIFTL